MAAGSTHISERIDRPPGAVYRYAANPANLPDWAAGLGTAVAEVDGRWVADSPIGRVTVAFAEPNSFGVLDHDVTLPSGETVYNPMRVLAHGSGSEVVFTLRRRAETTEAELRADIDAVTADLARLKRVLEDRRGQDGCP